MNPSLAAHLSVATWPFADVPPLRYIPCRDTRDALAVFNAILAVNMLIRQPPSLADLSEERHNDSGTSSKAEPCRDWSKR